MVDTDALLKSIREAEDGYAAYQSAIRQVAALPQPTEPRMRHLHQRFLSEMQRQFTAEMNERHARQEQADGA